MLVLTTGLLLFLVIHLVPTQPDLRAGIVARFGPGAYKSIFAIVSFVGLALIAIGYGKLQGTPGKNPEIWTPPYALRHVSLLLMLPAMILLVAAYVPSRIRDRVRHPMLLAVKLWAVAHLLANGDLASMLLFGALLAYAVFDLISVKRRGALGPLGAAKGTAGGDIAAVVGGIALYAVLLVWAHKWLIGVAPIVTRFSS